MFARLISAIRRRLDALPHETLRMQAYNCLHQQKRT